MVPEISATLGVSNEIRVRLVDNHFTIVNYASEEDNNFQKVSTKIAELVGSLRTKDEMSVGTYITNVIWKAHVQRPPQSFKVKYDSLYSPPLFRDDFNKPNISCSVREESLFRWSGRVI